MYALHTIFSCFLQYGICIASRGLAREIRYISVGTYINICELKGKIMEELICVIAQFGILFMLFSACMFSHVFMMHVIDINFTENYNFTPHCGID